MVMDGEAVQVRSCVMRNMRTARTFAPWCCLAYQTLLVSLLGGKLRLSTHLQEKRDFAKRRYLEKLEKRRKLEERLYPQCCMLQKYLFDRGSCLLPTCT